MKRWESRKGKARVIDHRYIGTMYLCYASSYLPTHLVLFRPFFLLANRDTSALEATTLFPIRPGCACHCRLTIQPGDTCMTYRLPATVTSCHDALLPTDALLINFTSSARPREARKREMEASRRGGILEEATTVPWSLWSMNRVEGDVFRLFRTFCFAQVSIEFRDEVQEREQFYFFFSWIFVIEIALVWKYVSRLTFNFKICLMVSLYHQGFRLFSNYLLIIFHILYFFDFAFRQKSCLFWSIIMYFYHNFALFVSNGK